MPKLLKIMHSTMLTRFCQVTTQYKVNKCLSNAREV